MPATAPPLHDSYARLRDGTLVFLRPLVPADRSLIADLLERMSPRSRHMRFCAPLPRVPARLLDAIAAVDDDRHVGWIALASGRPVGHAHAVRTGAGEAEMAVMVADDLHRRGLARLLVERLREDAAGRGIERLAVEIDPGNAAAIAMARSEGTRLALRDGLLSGAQPARNALTAATTRSRSAASGTW